MSSPQVEKKLILFADGGSRGNPGPAASGVYLEFPAENLRLLCGKYLGTNTNNFAEYNGVILGLEKALEATRGDKEFEIDFYLDSALVVQQLNGVFRIKAANLAPLVAKVHALETNFKSVSYTHVPREKNKRADSAVNIALDEKKDFQKKVN